MNNGDKLLGDFHKPSRPEKHTTNSIGNQQIWNQGKQVGAIEYVINPKTQSLDVGLYPSGNKDKKLTDL
ncbi:MAG: hypothetical protein NTY53_07545 [Kiritimatiellaeota bacterium]|nr:hypothetical protein [Kiritimatiellota bacterium]